MADPVKIPLRRRHQGVRWNLSAWDGWNAQRIRAVADHYGFSMDTPWEELHGNIQEIVLYGTGEKIDMSYESDNMKNHLPEGV